MIYIIRNPILWLGISAYVSLFFDRRCSPDYFFRNVNKMAAWIPDDKKKIKETMFNLFVIELVQVIHK
jgi:multimeric flavodoxin WrbA